MSDNNKTIKPSTPTQGKPSQVQKSIPSKSNIIEQRGRVELTGNPLPPRKPGQK